MDADDRRLPPLDVRADHDLPWDYTEQEVADFEAWATEQGWDETTPFLPWDDTELAKL